MQIRPVNFGDIDTYAAPLSELGAATFTDSFGHLYRAEDLSAFVAKNHSEQAHRRIIESEDHHSWVAEDDGHLFGYLTLCPNGLPCDPPETNAIELGRLYIRKSHQGLGLGQQFMDVAIPFARQAGFKVMVLSVWAENYGGHRFYRRNGFEKIGEYQFPVGDHLDDEWIMRRAL